jgi:hypothetical protein
MQHSFVITFREKHPLYVVEEISLSFITPAKTKLHGVIMNAFIPPDLFELLGPQLKHSAFEK